ncbi:MAG TPA: hypothetical protein VNO20_04830 [Solirubrobacterales bacterium]|nr:hypothetical protein [Solirubrobacterales bacterium]
MAGLKGRADRIRVIEALAKLAELGALEELPREDRKNSPRIFDRRENPYWGLVQNYLSELEAPSSAAGQLTEADDAKTGARRGT